MATRKKHKPLYPGTSEADHQATVTFQPSDDEPDTFGIAPNYDKFTRKGWTVEEVLSWFNID